MHRLAGLGDGQWRDIIQALRRTRRGLERMYVYSVEPKTKASDGDIDEQFTMIDITSSTRNRTNQPFYILRKEVRDNLAGILPYVIPPA